MTTHYTNARGDKVVRFDNMSIADRKRLFGMVGRLVVKERDYKVWQSPSNDAVDKFLVAINR